VELECICIVENKHDLENVRDHLHAQVIVGFLFVNFYLYFTIQGILKTAYNPVALQRLQWPLPFISPHRCQLTALPGWIKVITRPNDDNGMGKKICNNGIKSISLIVFFSIYSIFKKNCAYISYVKGFQCPTLTHIWHSSASPLELFCQLQLYE